MDIWFGMLEKRAKLGGALNHVEGQDGRELRLFFRNDRS